MSNASTQSEIICEYCGGGFRYDQMRRCWTCDGIMCPQCVQHAPEPLCPECTLSTLPRHISPMLAKLGKLPADWENWAFEFKWDGVRALFYWDMRRPVIESRNLIDVTSRYPELADLGRHFDAPVILDGEIVALDAQAHPSFTLLQERMHAPLHEVERRSRLVKVWYFVFDILYWNGRDLMSRPFYQRRSILEERSINHPFCRTAPLHIGNGRTILTVAQKHGLEGVVCKKQNSIYRPGVRSPDWTKVKFVRTADLIIGGFRFGQDRTNRIGSLQMGAYDQNLNLRYVGSVGTGFSESDHHLLLEKLLPLQRQVSPFSEPAPPGVLFVQPILVAQIEYRRWPENGMVQQAAYKGLRSDKSASEILLENIDGT
ncbi:MAG: non-homologous end-joining DNA ligase [Planctomycetaceae bacterium]|nr:non-homologous end-joining DNA ligase [Planctomycetaceae bacterium]